VREALDAACGEVPGGSGVWEAIRFARSLVGQKDAVQRIHERYAGLPPVHALNNLALVVWALHTHEDDYSAAIGDVVAAGWDTDCNGATVGGLWGLTGRPIPEHWNAPWRGRVEVTLAGVGELALDDLAARTVVVAERIAVAAGEG
jgi:ADP-ribosylglycohydrolase